MSASIGTKRKKKQSSLSNPQVEKTAPPALDRKLENAILLLENACIAVLDDPIMSSRGDGETTYWQHIFVNIATPVSLSLMESKGPRHFHYHYRHREGDALATVPVLENPIDMLAQVCAQAHRQCQRQLVGIQYSAIAKRARSFESALRSFLLSYEKSRAD